MSVTWLKRWVVRERWGIGVVAIMWLAFFSRTLTGQQLYFFDDFKIIYYPLEHVYAQFQRAWELPVWSNLFGFGQPLLAWGQLGFFTPLHVVLRAVGVPPLTLLQISIVTYFGLGLLGMYMFLRIVRVRQEAAALGAILYVFSGFNVAHLNHVNFYTGTMLLPWLLYVIRLFLIRPTAHRASWLALIVAAMALSAQPQVVLYTVLIAALYGIVEFGAQWWRTQGASLRYLGSIVVGTLIAAGLALLLASFSVWPLAEFLPLTERADAIPEAVLFEFSYPLQHVITLVMPYFFGDHSSYWGAKGFQELAAYTGIIPLMLAGWAVGTWRRWGVLRLVAVILVVSSAWLALGRYSPLYSWLVTHKLITALNIPGRFVFWFTTGISLLAALGLMDLWSMWRARRVPPLPAVTSLLVPVVLFGVWFSVTDSDERIWLRWVQLTTTPSVALILVLAGLGGMILAFIGGFWRARWARLALVLLTAVTLLAFGWNYNPLTERAVAVATSPLMAALADDAQQQMVPPRLYSRDDLLQSSPSQAQFATDEITPTFSVYQPLTVHHASPCFIVPIYQHGESRAPLVVSLLPELTAPALSSVLVTSQDVRWMTDQRICFPEVTVTPERTYILAFTSDDATGLTLAFARADVPSAYLSRVRAPTSDQLARSQKLLHIAAHQDLHVTIDRELMLGARHLQVAAGASSARWIGALSILPYREFSEFFFANDEYPYDGDGAHVLERYRTFFNFAGVSHFAQHLEPAAADEMPAAGFTTRAESQLAGHRFVLYTNLAVLPRALVVPDAVFKPARDETRVAMLEPTFDPRQLVYIAGPVPPDHVPVPTGEPLDATAEILSYTDTAVDVQVHTPRDSWLVLTDATTPQWQTLVDGVAAPFYVADTVFKAARVPAGEHTVSFRYVSPAVSRAGQLSAVGVLLVIVLWAWPWMRQLYRRTLFRLSHVR